MTLNRQSNILAWLAAFAVIVVIAATRFSVLEVRNQFQQIAMAENTIKGVTNFRFLIMETAFYNEKRSAEQWQRRVTSFEAMLLNQRYSEANENALLERELLNLKVITNLYDRLTSATLSLGNAPTIGAATSTELTASTVSALFLTTQDMLDDALELARLNRLDLTEAQNQAARIIQISIAILTALIAIGCVIIKRSVLVPIAALTEGTERVTKGNLSFRLDLSMKNEIGFLGNTFDHMTGQLEQAHDATQKTVRMLDNKTIELAQMQQQLHTIIDSMPALVGSWDTDFCNRFGNRAYSEWFGITPRQMRGKHMREIIGSDLFAQLEPNLLSVLEGKEEVFELAIPTPNGNIRHAIFSSVPDVQNGIVKGFYGFVSDITQLKQTQISKEKALAQLQGILDAAMDFAIIEGDEKGIITLFSKGAETLLGYKAEEIVGKTDGRLFHIPEEVIARSKELTLQCGRVIRGFGVFIELARQGLSESREWTYVRKDGLSLPVNVTVTAIHDRLGNITGYLGIAKDIRKDKEILQTLAETRDKAEAASLAKSQFLANMSHEIRTPMNAILGMLQLLQHTELTPRQLDYAVKTQSAAQSLLSLLNDILDFSKVEAGKMTLESVPFRLDSLMRDLSVIFSSSVGNKDIEVLFSIDPQLPSCILGDPLRLRQVLINLAGNAIKFTKHGEVIVSLQVVKQNANRTEIVFSVKDSGIGIAPEQLAYIFEGFSQAEASTTRRFGGTGLGLAISQRLVSLMGGELAVESTLEIGSRFHFTLSFEHADEDEASLPALTSQRKGLPRRALIVDDNDSAREILVSMVKSLGWQADEAASGGLALTMLRKNEAAPFPYDVVFMDWKMPDLDGWEAARQIRQLQHGNAASVIIMVTAHGREVLAERSLNDANLLNGFLVKPVTASMIFDAVIDSSQESFRVTAKRSSMRLAGLRLLLVEDTLMNQQVAEELLSSEGAIVEVADCGGVGVAKALAAMPPFDAILMDIQMPDMDGYVATGKIRQDPRMQSLPIIAMTANAMPADKAACRAAGMDDHIAKPIDLNNVVTTILRHCNPGKLSSTNMLAEGRTFVQNKLGIELDAALQRLGGNQTLFATLAKRFGDDIPPLLITLRQSLTQGDTLTAAGAIHTLKGISGTVGAVHLAKYAAQVEEQLKTAEATINRNVMMNALESLVTQTQSALEKIALELCPTIQSSSSEIKPIDQAAVSAALNTELDALNILLRSFNMQALSVFADLEKKYGNALDGQLSPLAQALNRLDFKLALECSDQLRTRLP